MEFGIIDATWQHYIFLDHAKEYYEYLLKTFLPNVGMYNELKQIFQSLKYWFY